MSATPWARQKAEEGEEDKGHKQHSWNDPQKTKTLVRRKHPNIK
jgi:hypothetical protein